MERQIIISVVRQLCGPLETEINKAAVSVGGVRSGRARLHASVMNKLALSRRTT